MVFVVD